MYCDGSVQIMWSLDVFTNHFPLPRWRVKSQSDQVIGVRPVHSLKVLSPSTVMLCTTILHNQKTNNGCKHTVHRYVMRMILHFVLVNNKASSKQ